MRKINLLKLSSVLVGLGWVASKKLVTWTTLGHRQPAFNHNQLHVGTKYSHFVFQCLSDCQDKSKYKTIRAPKSRHPHGRFKASFHGFTTCVRITDETTTLKQNYNTDRHLEGPFVPGWWNPPNTTFSLFQLHEPPSQVRTRVIHWCNRILTVLGSPSFRIRIPSFRSTARYWILHPNPEYKSIVLKSRRLWLYSWQDSAWITKGGSWLMPRLR